ncbi:UTP--glucose-1-phosphate uridylyltransferase [Nibea albiflora]|uniref:UTP--glucose-1-phosphate uridylyltransferase n=1 Tax=Nibea albiflora TaxID=240163 RepID=A0ACB7EDR2_NIBAL|nr:UTP--glucose-1-phosphate uridylyltransferase [Nibea albiflora]
MAEFQEMMRQQLESSMHTELEKLLDTSTGAEREASMKDFEGFKTLFHRFLQVKGPSVEWIKIQRPPEDSIQPYDKISARGLPVNVADCLNKLVHLNKTYNTDVPLVLMNSFNTDEDTKKILQKYTHHRVKIHTFNQSRYPRVNKESLLPGGTLIQYDGKLRLLEIAQVPKAHVDEFKSVSKFKIFNTNNLWISLAAIKRLQEQKAMDLEIIVNPKTLDGGQNVIQLETAVGAAIKCFDNAMGINVPRSRFLPVKTTSDLLLVMSNLYSLDAGSLTMSPKREFPTTPHVKLGSSFTKVQEYLTRFESIPDMLELDHLTVSGDVTFGKNVSLKGTVIIIANHGDRIDIPAGSMLENKIVSGNLRIMDH